MTNDIKKLDEWVESSRMLFEETSKLNIENIHAMGFNDKMIEKIKGMNLEDIPDMTLSTIESLFKECGIDKSDIELMYSKSFEKDKSYLVFVQNKIKEAKSDLDDIEKSKKELEDIEKQVRDMKQSFIDYVRSPEFKEKKLENVRRLKEQAENETDPVKKKKYLDQLNVIENIESSNFLLDRFEKYGNKEVESIMGSFFDNSKGEYMMRKFQTACTKFKFKPDMYQFFFNIEENLLPKEYHVFNNLFLFICMRFIAYADVNIKSDKMYVEKTINNLAHLIYHDFENQEEENKFLDLIKKIDDYFRDKEDVFNEQNTTHPNHPVRIEQMRVYKENKRGDLIKEIKEDYPDLYSDDELNEKSFDELLEIQEKKFTELVEENSDESDVDESN